MLSQKAVGENLFHGFLLGVSIANNPWHSLDYGSIIASCLGVLCLY